MSLGNILSINKNSDVHFQNFSSTMPAKVVHENSHGKFQPAFTFQKQLKPENKFTTTKQQILMTNQQSNNTPKSQTNYDFTIEHFHEKPEDYSTNVV